VEDAQEEQSRHGCDSRVAERGQREDGRAEEDERPPAKPVGQVAGERPEHHRGEGEDPDDEPYVRFASPELRRVEGYHRQQELEAEVEEERRQPENDERTLHAYRGAGWISGPGAREPGPRRAPP
jgi:hypothetical protein